MPAVTADLLTPPDSPRCAPSSASRPDPRGSSPLSARSRARGSLVRRPFPGIDLSLVDPFILLDQMGAVEYAPGEAKGAPDHPHRGFETVTYMMDGVIEHRDSMGGGGTITDGATQWMTAGSGIVHSEMPPEYLVRSGGLFHGVQLWVNLPASMKWSTPRYQDIVPTRWPSSPTPTAQRLVRIIAGELRTGMPGTGVTHTPIGLRTRHAPSRGTPGGALARRTSTR